MCVTIVKYQGFYLFAPSLILAALWYPFWEAFGAGCTFVDPPGSLMRVLWSTWVTPFRRSCVCSVILRVPLGCQRGQKGCSGMLFDRL